MVAQRAGLGSKIVLNGGFREFGYVAHTSRRAAETAVGPRREAQTGAAPMPERKGRPRRQGRENVENPKFEGKIYDRCRDKDETTSWMEWVPLGGAGLGFYAFRARGYRNGPGTCFFFIFFADFPPQNRVQRGAPTPPKVHGGGCLILIPTPVGRNGLKWRCTRD